ncbi:MAG: hypothetical protein ACKO1U_10710 [Bacteroidota bacterium]
MKISDEEFALLSDRRYYQVKSGLVIKLDGMFSELKVALSQKVADWSIPVKGVDTERGKIFRGENYAGFPYTLLDYPRMFKKEAVFAMRSMCWWGNEFSFALHLQGEALLPLMNNLRERLESISCYELHFCVHASPWQYDFGSDNYRPIASLTAEEMEEHVQSNGFIKLGRKFSLENHQALTEAGVETASWFREFLKH